MYFRVLTRSSFPSHVVEALLSINSCIESRQLLRVASLLDGYKEQLLQVLHTNSWHFLACIFLKSDSAADQERALQILQVWRRGFHLIERVLCDLTLRSSRIQSGLR